MNNRISLGGLIYVIIGVIVAVNRGYFVDLATIGHILSAFLAVLLWPLLILGVNLHLAI
jgi:hypothetical protein